MSCVGLKQSDVTGMMVRWSSLLRCACVMNSRRGAVNPTHGSSHERTSVVPASRLAS